MKKLVKALKILMLFFLIAMLIGTVVLKVKLHDVRHTHRPCIQETPEDWGFVAGGYERVTLTTRDGLRIEAQLFYSQAETKASVVIVHGAANDACLEFMYPLAQPFVDAGYNVMVITMRNFGASDGDLTSFGYSEWRDVAAAVTWLELRYPQTPVFTLGLSMGGGTSLIAGALGYGDAIVLLNPYLDTKEATTWRLKTQYHIPEDLSEIPAVLAEKWELGSIAQHSPMDFAKEYQPIQPILIIGGSRDQILPPRTYEELNEVLPNSRLKWVDGRHNLIREDSNVLNQVIQLALEFFDKQVALLK